MCIGCYVDRGAPIVITDQVLDAAELLSQEFPDGGVDGYTHLVVEDWNIEDWCVTSCLEDAVALKPFGFNSTDDDNYDDYPRELAPRDVEVLGVLAALSLNERATAMAIWDGFVGKDGERIVTHMKTLEGNTVPVTQGESA
jgi:hypothetical protein